ncbi:MAG: hypothetical protein QOK20_3460 [Acidimicrobiaceae bacterium]|nr:hypothetical protein [Acidimicrobiaceae bacterium]
MLRMFLARRHEGFAGRWMLILRPRQGVWARVEMRRCPLQGQVLECKSVVRGHGILAALIASLVMGSYRHDRPRRIIPSTESTPTSKGRRSAIRRFPAATGPLARIDLEPGGSNAGHLPPICGGTAHGELHCAPARRQPPVLTDGLVEAHLPAEGAFGVDRRDRLSDDATVVSFNGLDHCRPDRAVVCTPSRRDRAITNRPIHFPPDINESEESVVVVQSGHCS